MSTTMTDCFDLESLVNVEQTFALLPFLNVEKSEALSTVSMTRAIKTALLMAVFMD